MNLLSLMEPLPTSREEISQNHSIYEVQRAVLLKVYQKSFTQREIYHLAPFMKVLGTEYIMDELIASYDDHPQETLDEAFLAVVFHTPWGKAFFNTLSEDRRIALSGPWLYPILDLAHKGIEFPQIALYMLLKSTGIMYRKDLLAKIEGYRVAKDLSLQVYEMCLPLEGASFPSH